MVTRSGNRDSESDARMSALLDLLAAAVTVCVARRASVAVEGSRARLQTEAQSIRERPLTLVRKELKVFGRQSEVSFVRGRCVEH